MSPGESPRRPGQGHGQQRRKHRHAGDRAQAEQCDVEQADDRVLDGRRGQDHQGRRSGQPMDHAHEQRPHGQSARMGMNVMVGIMANVFTRMTMDVEMGPAVGVAVKMEMKAGAPQANEHLSAQQDQHHADDALQHLGQGVTEAQIQDDSRTGEDIMNLFDTLYDAGQTIILVTHETHIADRAHRHVQLHDGVVTQDHSRSRTDVQ